MRDPQYMKGIHARIIEKRRAAVAQPSLVDARKRNCRGFQVRVKRLFKQRSSAGAGLGAFEARYPLNPIDSPRSPAGWARTRLFITAHHKLLQISQAELLYGCLENKGLHFHWLLSFPPTNSATQSLHLTAK